MPTPIQIQATKLELPFTLSQLENKKLETDALVLALDLTFEGVENFYARLVALGIGTVAAGEQYDSIDLTKSAGIAPVTLKVTEHPAVGLIVDTSTGTAIVAVEPSSSLSVTIEESKSVDVKNRQPLKVILTNENLTAAGGGGETPTLQTVTDAGAITTNDITTGSVTSNGNFLITGNDSTVQLRGSSVDFNIQTTAADNVARIATTTGGSARLDLYNHISGFNGALEFRATSWENDALVISGGTPNTTKFLVSRDPNAATLQVTGESYFTSNVGIGTTAPNSKVHISGTAMEQLRMETAGGPSSAGDASGRIGDMAYDDDYFYIKTTNGWGRMALDFGY